MSSLSAKRKMGPWVQIDVWIHAYEESRAAKNRWSPKEVEMAERESLAKSRFMDE